MNSQEISDKFINKFVSEFGDQSVTQLNDIIVGVSIKKDYPLDLIKKLRIRDNRTYKSLIYVLIENDDMLNESLKKKSIFIKIDFTLESGNNRYLFNNDFIGNKKYCPINIVASREYFYQVDEDKFYKSDIEISPKQIIDELFDKHVKTSENFRGAYLRTQLLFWRKLYPYLIFIISNFFVILSFILFGEKNPLDIHKRYYKEAFKDKSSTVINPDFKAAFSDKILFLGYNISKWSLASYSSIVLLIYVGFNYSNFKPHLLIGVSRNNFLLLAFVALSLTIYDLGIPKFFKWMIAKTSKYYVNIQFKQIKV